MLSEMSKSCRSRLPARIKSGRHFKNATRTVSVWLGLLVILTFQNSAPAKDTLAWRTAQNTVDAQIESWDLTKVLREVAGATGWEIYLEPDTQLIVSVKFKSLPPGEALRRLLGDLNFALLPQTIGPSKLFIYRTSLQEATQLIPVPANPASEAVSKRLLPNELIVTLRPNAKKSIQELARRLGAKVVSGLDELNTYRLQFKDEESAKAARELLGLDSDVSDLNANYSIGHPTQTERLQLSSPPPFALKPKISTDTSKVVIGLIDTSVQTLAPGMNEFLLPALRVADDAPASNIQLNHGTSMAETILHGLTLSPQETGGSSVRVLPVDVYGNNPETTTFDVARGIYAAINAGATIINLSMGGDGDNGFLGNLIQESHKGGVLFFGAAGNQPSTTPTYPAAYPDVVAVTAGDKRGNIAPYANRGGFVDVIAPGLSIVQFNGESYLVSGTSASTAYVSGTAAGYRATGKTASQVEEYIRQSLAVKPPAKPTPRP